MNFSIGIPQKQRVWFNLGRIVTNMAILERVVISAISYVAKIDRELCLSMVARDNFETLLKTLESVFAHEIHDINLTIEMDDFLKKLRAVNDKRNTYIHASWFYFPDNPLIVCTQRVSKGKIGKSKKDIANVKDVNIADLEKLVNDIIKLRESFSSFIVKNSSLFKSLNN